MIKVGQAVSPANVLSRQLVYSFIRSFAALTLALLSASSLLAQDGDKWIRVTSSHFEMYATCDQKKATDAILHFERVRDFFMEASPVKPPAEFPTRIVIFRNPDLFYIYAPNRSIAAYYAPGPLRDSIVMGEPSAESYPVTIHEYVHLVIRHSGLRLPVWLNEGWAEVYSTLRPVKDGVAVGDLIDRHVKDLGQGRWMSLTELEAVNHSSPAYNEASRQGLFYAESWALTHMLYLSPDYKKNFGAFIGALNKGRSITDALTAAFGKTEAEVFADLREYLGRKKLYGTVFMTPFEKSGDTPVVTPVTTYDSYLMLADLHSASHHFVEADRLYKQLETDDPKRPDAFAADGYLALGIEQKENARVELRKAYDLGSTDPQLCLQLATLDRAAKQPPAIIMAELERAVKLRPDFTEALFELGVMKVDTREFDQASALLARVGNVGPDRMAIYRYAIAYVDLQRGNIDLARSGADAARKAASTPAQIQAADQLVKLIEARSKGPAEAHPGESVIRAKGTALGLLCAAAGSGEMSKMGITIDGKQIMFDMPDPVAVELARKPGVSPELKCGALQPFPIIVEFTPSSVANQQTAGIIRRLEY
jgi:tetratricopeptide (TPR) repeat protein